MEMAGRKKDLNLSLFEFDSKREKEFKTFFFILVLHMKKIGPIACLPFNTDFSLEGIYLTIANLLAKPKVKICS